MNQFMVEVIPNELPFRNSFWSPDQCVFCQEVFTLASFVTATFAILFAVLGIVAVMYWFQKEEPAQPRKPSRFIKGRTRYPTTS